MFWGCVLYDDYGGRLGVGVTTTWDVCLLLTKRVPGTSYKRFPSRQAAEEWLKLVHDIEDAVLLNMAAAKAAVAQRDAATAPPALPALPAAVPSSSCPLSTSPDALGQLRQLLQQNLGDTRTIEGLKDLAFLPTASNGALASGSRALPAPSSSPDDPVFSTHAPYTRHKSGNSYQIAIDRTSDSDDAKPFASRPRPTAVPSSNSAAPSSASSTAAETSIPATRLAQSPGQARLSKRARCTSGDDITLGSSTADISDRFVNILPALLRLVDIFSNGNAVIITEVSKPTPGDDERRSDTLMGLDVSDAYNIPDIEETGCRQEIVKGKCKA
ncbi:hypothetical protein FOVSG1_013161 [Fusarium oxysporum f. sp. vasinfectum]